MACYEPLVGIDYGARTEEGKHRYKVVGKYDPVKAKELYPDSVIIPCGKCIGCRIDYSRNWADRMMLELETAQKAVFVTLTYDDDHLHVCYEKDGRKYGSLNKRDWQLFMKRLRKYFGDKKIRFYMAGEYGDRTRRPHYHAILFGLGLDDFSDLRGHGFNELRQRYYISDTLARIWSNGFVLLSDVSWSTCAYVARYVQKKVGKTSFLCDVYRQPPEFSLMSRKPGIGADYLEQHPDVLDYQNINLSTPEGGKKLQIPKYYLKKLSLTDPEKYAILSEERRRYADDHLMVSLLGTDKSYLELKKAEQEYKQGRLKTLKRSL